MSTFCSKRGECGSHTVLGGESESKTISPVYTYLVQSDVSVPKSGVVKDSCQGSIPIGSSFEQMQWMDVGLI